MYKTSNLNTLSLHIIKDIRDTNFRTLSSRELARKQLNEDVATYLANGGTIKQLQITDRGMQP